MRDRILKTIEHVISLYDAEIFASDKVFGPLETYSCRTVQEAYNKTSQKLDAEEFDDLTGMTEFHVFKVIFEASKVLTVVRTADLDRDIIYQEMAARAELAWDLIS